MNIYEEELKVRTVSQNIIYILTEGGDVPSSYLNNEVVGMTTRANENTM